VKQLDSTKGGTGTFSSAVDSRPLAGPERPAIRSGTRCPNVRQAPDMSAAPSGPPRASRSPCVLAAMALGAADELDELAVEAPRQH
jgi:hypothetical protein